MNNTALITGASSGIGKELAYIHATHGGDLILVARRQEKLEEIKQDIEEKYATKVMLIVKDLTQPTAAEEIYDEVKKANITIECLINNAGFGGLGNFHERNRADDKKMILLNIMALTELTKLFLADFVSKNEGKILNVSSTASFMPGPLQAVYFASKAYAQSFSNAIAYELKDTNITVTNLMPGATATEFSQSAGLEKTTMFQKTATAKSVAEDGYTGMLAGKLDVISGLTFMQKILIALIPFMPKKMMLQQVYNMQKVAERNIT